MITEEQLKEWEDTEKKATPGPWDIELIEDKSYADGSEVFDPEIYLGNGEYLTQVDAAFINQSRIALPLLIQAYREQQDEIERLQIKLNVCHVTDWTNGKPSNPKSNIIYWVCLNCGFIETSSRMYCDSKSHVHEGQSVKLDCFSTKEEALNYLWKNRKIE